MGWDDGPVHLTVKGTGEVVPCTSWEVEQRPGARTKALQGGPRADRLICKVIGILYVNP